MATTTAKKVLPIAAGASMETQFGGDSVRAEKITTDDGSLKSAGAASVAEPKVSHTETVADVVADTAADTARPITKRPELAAPYGGNDTDIAALHARFDQLEALVKRRVAVASLNTRFDNLEKWLNANF